MARWYYHSGGQQKGPIEEDALQAMVRSGQIGLDCLVWREGMAQWKPAQSVAELAPPIAAPAGATDGPMVLSYAAPAGTTTQPVPDDNGPFLRVCRYYTIRQFGFAVSDSRWSGRVIVSPRAFYLLKASRGSAGLAGGLLGMAITVALDGHSATRTCGVLELPEPVREALDPRWRKRNRDVIVLPREAISYVKAGRFNNLVTVFAGKEKFQLYRSIFRGGVIRRFLVGQGWILNQQLVPTMEPIHGKGFGLDAQQRKERRNKSLFQGLILAVIAIAIIVFLIFLHLVR